MTYQNFPKKTLGFFPTPLMDLSQLSDALGGPQIFMKRDDMTGLALGGNKTRKLEYLIGDAIAKGYDTIITAGAAQSNHCRQTVAAAAYSKLECHLVLGGERPNKASGNLLLDNILGCHIHWTGENRKGEDIPRIYEQLVSSGKKPYIIPYGGSNELGVLSFIEAFEELDEQNEGEPFSHIVFASSSGGTHAGLILGNQLLKNNVELIGINIDKDETGQVPLDDHIVNLVKQTAELIDLETHFLKQELVLKSNYVGDGYGIVGQLEKEAISLTAQYEGILLDPVYTGRAMGGLIDMIRTGTIDQNDKVLFWHTGGTPALFAYSDDLISQQDTNEILQRTRR